MRTAAIVSGAVVAFSSLAAAAPGGWGDWHGKHGNNNYNNKECAKSPFEFTSTYSVVATPDQVVSGTGDASKPAPGQPGAIGYYNFGLNSHENVICFNITLMGVKGEYQSMAKTSTHLHEAVKGKGGPPRIAFPNPVGDDYKRVSLGCLTGPFMTGIMANGVDTGAAFHVSKIEANPAGFFVDVHTAAFVPGAVRGQVA